MKLSLNVFYFSRSEKLRRRGRPKAFTLDYDRFTDNEVNDLKLKGCRGTNTLIDPPPPCIDLIDQGE